jgi:hypothetical protein
MSEHGSLAELLRERGDGNPFVMIEYLRAIVDAGLLRPSWGEWLLDEDGLAALELPQGRPRAGADPGARSQRSST